MGPMFRTLSHTCTTRQAHTHQHTLYWSTNIHVVLQQCNGKASRATSNLYDVSDGPLRVSAPYTSNSSGSSPGMVTSMKRYIVLAINREHVFTQEVLRLSPLGSWLKILI